jgi:hypothetical protein
VRAPICRSRTGTVAVRAFFSFLAPKAGAPQKADPRRAELVEELVSIAEPTDAGAKAGAATREEIEELVSAPAWRGRGAGPGGRAGERASGAPEWRVRSASRGVAPPAVCISPPSAPSRVAAGGVQGLPRRRPPRHMRFAPQLEPRPP